jgi:PAS domain S-box-containing protein
MHAHQTINMQKKYAQYKLLVSDIVLAVLFFVIAVFISYRQTRRANQTAASVSNTLEILFHKEKLASLTTDHETGSRAYILTGQPQFLETVQRSKQEIPEEIRTIRRLTLSNPLQKRLIDSLAVYFRQREIIADSAIASRAVTGSQAAITLLITGNGKRYVDNIRRLLDIFHEQENNLYSKHLEENEKALLAQNKIFLSAVFCLLLALFFFSFREKKRIAKEHRERSATLRQSEKRFRALVEHNDNIIALMDENMRTFYRSPSAERITGWSADERGKLGGADLNHPEHMEQMEEMMKRVIANPGKPYPVLMRTKHKTGEWIWLEGYFTNMFHDPEVNGIIANLRDVTEEKRVKDEVAKLNEELEEKVTKRTDQLQAANNDMEAFTYSVSHDLRAPLRIISGFTTILEEDYAAKLDDEAKRLTSIIKKNTLKMGRLIDGLLDFSRMRLQDIHQSVIDTNQLVEEVVKTFSENAPRQIEWIIGGLPETWGDINSIRQVWINLVSNAVKYSGKTERPEIEIGSFRKQDQTIFFIKDNGVGFDTAYTDKLFKVFQRLHSGEDFEGTGVGLAVVHKVISKHGGKVWAEGETGKGATFYFSLPEERTAINTDKL